jgi:signal peptidase I
MFYRNFDRRQWLITTAGSLCTIGGAVAAWQFGRSSHVSLKSTFQVNGGSMCPTLWGESLMAQCPSCEIRFRVDTSPTSIQGPSDSFEIRCWHCGAPISCALSNRYSGDLVQIQPIFSREDFDFQQLVACSINETLAIKRIAGRPGQTIDVADVGNRKRALLLDGIPIESRTAVIPVDRDALRKLSRWHNHSTSSDQASWLRTDVAWTVTLSPESPQSSRLQYQHLSVYDHGLASPIYDDYPANASLTRRLFPVSRVHVSMAVTVTHDVVFEFAGNEIPWTSNQKRFSFELSADDVGFSVHSESKHRVNAEVKDLALDRRIEYRLRPGDDASPYPIKLGRHQYFVLGDNVPISVDSRDFGPIHRNDVYGTVAIP